MPHKIQPPSYDEISRWLSVATSDDNTKTASAKKKASEMGLSGSATKDPGGYTGPSSHPSARAASNTQSTPLGERAKENESDNKEDRGPAAVDSTSAEGGGDQDSKQIHVGMNPSSTGEDPSVEDDYKGDKEDAETSHPANADDTGEKYSSWDLSRLLKQANTLADDILSDIGMGFGFTDPNTTPVERLQQQRQPQPTKQAAASTPQNKADNTAAVEAGYELANLLGLSKEAADQQTQTFVAGILKEALDDADRVGAYIVSYKQAEDAQSKKVAGARKKAGYKKAEEEEESGEGEESESHEGHGGEESAPVEGGGEVPPDIAAALGGAGGGAPPEAAPPMGPEAGGGAPGAGGEEAALQDLVMALLEKGIPPEQLPELVAAMVGGGGGGGAPAPGGMGGDPAAAGAPPMGGDPMGGGAPPAEPMKMAQKIASAASSYMRSGKFRLSEPKTAASKKRREAMKAYISEITGR